MAQSMIDRYRRWFDYEKDAHAKVLKSLASVREDKRGSPAFVKATSIMGHIVAARQLWLYRLGIRSDAPTDFFPQGLTLADLDARLSEMHAAWTSCLGRLNDSDLAREFTYQSLDAGRFRNSIEDIFTQLFGHSWYHRGQIASLVKLAGGEPAATDFVYWTRQEVAV